MQDKDQDQRAGVMYYKDIASRLRLHPRSIDRILWAALRKIRQSPALPRFREAVIEHRKMLDHRNALLLHNDIDAEPFED